MGLHQCQEHGLQAGPLCCQHIIAAIRDTSLQTDLVRSGIDWSDDGSEVSKVLVCSDCAAAANISPDSLIAAEVWESGSRSGTFPWVAPTCHICIQELVNRLDPGPFRYHQQ